MLKAFQILQLWFWCLRRWRLRGMACQSLDQNSVMSSFDLKLEYLLSIPYLYFSQEVFCFILYSYIFLLSSKTSVKRSSKLHSNLVWTQIVISPLEIPSIGSYKTKKANSKSVWVCRTYGGMLRNLKLWGEFRLANR